MVAGCSDNVDPVDTTLPEQNTAAPSPRPPEPIAAEKPATDPASEMRRAGWIESEADGDACLMERRSRGPNRLNFVFIYGERPNRTYELSFTSSRQVRDEMADALSEESHEWAGNEVAVLLDGTRIPATLQNHYSDTWEVEIPLTSAIHRQLVRASSIALEVNGETLVVERIVNNATAAESLARCLKP